jgi:2-oxoglutarate dehydrogenase complex dehydrogenase (E1) component-like enzyme
LREVVIGCPTAVALNVLANTVGKPISQIFAEFEGNDLGARTRARAT